MGPVYPAFLVTVWGMRLVSLFLHRTVVPRLTVSDAGTNALSFREIVCIRTPEPELTLEEPVPELTELDEDGSEEEETLLRALELLEGELALLPVPVPGNKPLRQRSNSSP